MMGISYAKTALALLLVLAAGCRTYGGRDSEAITFRQIEAAVQDYARAYDRANANAAALEQAAKQDSAAATLARKYRALVATHGARLTDQRERMEELRGSDDYRALSRTLGGVVKEQQVMAKGYRNLMARYRPGGDTTVVAFEVPPRGRYYLVPPFYEAARNEAQPRLPGLARSEVGGTPTDTAQTTVPRPARRDTTP
jgi:multidrug efflux pump subunit AcrA (membrane-fusion protein)